jgi:hypothetical protein
MPTDLPRDTAPATDSVEFLRNLADTNRRHAIHGESIMGRECAALQAPILERIADELDTLRSTSVSRDTAPSAAHEAKTAQLIVDRECLIDASWHETQPVEADEYNLMVHIATRMLIRLDEASSELASLRSALATAQKLNEPESPDEENAFQDMGGWPAIDALRAENVALRSSLAEATEARTTARNVELMLLDQLRDRNERLALIERGTVYPADHGLWHVQTMHVLGSIALNRFRSVAAAIAAARGVGIRGASGVSPSETASPSNDPPEAVEGTKATQQEETGNG